MVNKITAEDLINKGVIGLPDVPGLTTIEMQKKFDEISIDVIIPRFNELIDNTVSASDEFSKLNTYNVGDYCIYQSVLYKCTTAITIAGEWDATKWKATSIDKELKEISSYTESKDVISDKYDSSKTYSVGDYCIYDDTLYKCKTEITSAEEFDSSKWEPTNCGKEFEVLNSNLTIRYNQETDMVQVLGESGEWYDWKSIGLKAVSLYDSGVKGKFGMNSAIWKCAQSSGTTSVVFNANSITMKRYWNTGIAADGCMIFTTSPFNLADYNTIILDATLSTACVMEFYFTTVYPEFNNNYMPTGATLLKSGVTASGEYNFNGNVPEGTNVYFIATITSTSSNYTDVSATIKSIKLKRT